MRRSLLLITAAAAALTLTSCAGAGADGPTPAPSGSNRPPFRSADPAPLGPTGTPAAVPPARWQAIVDDLTARGITGDPEVVSAEEVVFSDGSLGCPSPGVAYTQALVDGMRVIVRAGDAQYDYRFGGTDTPKLCAR